MTQKDRDALDDWLKTAKGPFVLDAHVPHFGSSYTSYPRTGEDIPKHTKDLRAQYPRAKIVFSVRSSCVMPPELFVWTEEAAPEPETLDQWIKALGGTRAFRADVYRDDLCIAHHYQCKYPDAASFLGRMSECYKRKPPTRFLLTDEANTDNTIEHVVEGERGEAWDGTVAGLDKAIIEKALSPKNEEAAVATTQTTRYKTLEEWMAQIKRPQVTIKGLDKNGTEVFRHDYDSHLSGVKVRESLQFDLREWLSPLRLPVRMTASDGESASFMWDVTDLSRNHPCWDLVAPTLPPKPASPMLAASPPPPVDRGPSVVQEPDLYEGEPDYDEQDTQDDTSIKPGDLVVHALSGTHGRVVQFVPDHEIRARTLDTAHEARVSVPAWAVDTKDGLKIYPEGSLEVVDETSGQTAWALMGFVGGTLAATVFWVLVTGVLWR